MIFAIIPIIWVSHTDKRIFEKTSEESSTKSEGEIKINKEEKEKEEKESNLINKSSDVEVKTEISSDPLGLKIEDLSEENSRPNDPESGVLVLRVNNGSQAYGKLARGDIITEVISRGKRYTIEDAKSFEDLVEELEKGDKIAIVGRRNSNRFFVAVTVD